VYFAFDVEPVTEEIDLINYKWLEIEVIVFYGFIIGGVVFMFLGCVFEYISFFGEEKREEDFMKYA